MQITPGMAVFTRFSGGFCILLLCVAPAAPPPLWAVPGPPVHEKRTPTAADAHDLKIVVKLRAVPTSKVPFPVEIAGFPDFSRPVPVYPAFLKYVVPVHRLHLRNDVKGFNKKLATAAQDAGVQNFGKFQNYGYKGLYNGETAADIKERKGLKKGENILDHMGSTELAANYFRITQTEEKLRRENVQGENNANMTHYHVGQKVRQTIKELGGTMPEELPTPEKSIKQIEREQKKLENK